MPSTSPRPALVVLGVALITVAMIVSLPLATMLMMTRLGSSWWLPMDWTFWLLPVTMPAVFAPLLGACIDRFGLRSGVVLAAVALCGAFLTTELLGITLTFDREFRFTAWLLMAASIGIAGIATAALATLATVLSPRMAACAYGGILAALLAAYTVSFLNRGASRGLDAIWPTGLVVVACALGTATLALLNPHAGKREPTLVPTLTPPNLRLIAIAGLLGLAEVLAIDSPQGLGLSAPPRVVESEYGLAGAVGIALGVVAAWEWRERALPYLLWFRAGLLLCLALDLQFGLVSESATMLSPSAGQILIVLLVSIEVGPAIMYRLAQNGSLPGIGALCGWVFAAGWLGNLAGKVVIDVIGQKGWDDEYAVLGTIVSTLLMVPAGLLARPAPAGRRSTPPAPG